MSLLEILLTPVYIFIFYLIFKFRGRKLADDTLKKYHIRGFWVKMLASILFVFYYTYLTGGDTRSLYYAEGKNLYHLLMHDSSNWKYVFMNGKDFNTNLVAKNYNVGYFREEGNFFVIKITALLGFLTYGYYTLINLFFACFAYSGLWKLFMFFYQQRPFLHKAFAISILFFPSVVFWSAGLLKDSLCIGALGWLTFSLYNLLKRKAIVVNGFLLIISVYILAVTKIYILLAYAPFLLLFIFLKKIKAVKVPILKYFITISIIAAITFVFSQTYESYEDELGGYAIENLTSSISNLNEVIGVMSGREGAESNFNLGATFDGTFPGMLRIAPFAIVATFFRPFIWETGKISQLMAAVESLILIFFTLKIFFRAGPFRVIKDALSDPMITFCLLFAIVFGLFVGASTLNFGTLVRYKIPCMPFYAIALFLLYDKMKIRKEARKAQKTTEIAVAAPVV